MPEHASRFAAALYDQFEDEHPVADWGGDELFTRMPRPRAVDDAPAPRFRPYLAASEPARRRVRLLRARIDLGGARVRSRGARIAIIVRGTAVRSRGARIRVVGAGRAPIRRREALARARRAAGGAPARGRAERARAPPRGRERRAGDDRACRAARAVGRRARSPCAAGTSRPMTARRPPDEGHHGPSRRCAAAARDRPGRSPPPAAADARRLDRRAARADRRLGLRARPAADPDRDLHRGRRDALTTPA